MSPQKVLLMMAVRPDKIGGMEVFAAKLAQHLRQQNGHLTIGFEAEPPSLVREFLTESGNVSLVVQARQSSMRPRDNLRFLRLLLQERPSVVIYSLGGLIRFWPRLAKLVGVKRVVYYDQTSRIEGAKTYRASPKVQKLMTSVDLQVCATQFIQRCANSEGVLPLHKTRVIYNSVDTRRSVGDGGAFRRKAGIPEGRIVCLQVSWLVPEKGIDVALRAAAISLAKRDDLHFVFAGDGAHMGEYVRLAQELRVAERVTWTGQVVDLFGDGVFAAADILLQCSVWHEAFSLAVAEGMSAGLPVIASRIGGLPEVVTEGETGFLVTPQSEGELSQAILALAGDPEGRQRMGQAGRKKAVEMFDVHAVLTKWTEALV